MAVLVWVAEGTWPACIDAAAQWAPPTSDVVLLVTEGNHGADAAHTAFAGMLGRGRAERDPGARIAAMGAAATEEMLEAAAGRLGRASTARTLSGRPERALVEAAAGAELLVLARDGELERLGPHSLGPVTRFVVDHAPCPILLVWPRRPTTTALPPPPPGPPPPRP
jgi:nucleotide-binding universal stress UspA family protein